MLFLLHDSLLEEICHELLDCLLLSWVDLVWIGDTLVFEIGVDKLFRTFFGEALNILFV